MRGNHEVAIIGLPTNALIIKSKTQVHRVDIDQKVVDNINRGEIHIEEPELDKAISEAVNKGYSKASTKDFEANTYLMVVPTPFKVKNEPDIPFQN
jgi:UDP-N-acetyl-D-mannosaminuronic acid dehydrogenase